MTGLTVLAVDDEPPALDELAYLLRADPRIGEVRSTGESATALRLLEDNAVEAVFLDIRMPGLSGLDLARVLRQFAHPPKVVFVTAHDDAAVDAFALDAVDYLLKPLRPDRLAEAIGRIVGDGWPEPAAPVEESVAVELAGVTRLVPVAEIAYVEAQGDYARLHTAAGSHLLRVSLATLEERWGVQGFVRIHRSYLVAVDQVVEFRVDAGGGHAVTRGGATLPVSRRHTREFKDRLVRRT